MKTILCGQGVVKAREETIRAGQEFYFCLILWHSFVKQKYYQNRSKSNGVYLKNSLPKIV